MNIDDVLKPQNNSGDILDSKESVLDQKSQYLEPTTKRSFELMNEDTLKSKRNITDFPEDEFTNFLNKKLEPEFIHNVYEYARDWNKLDEGTIDADTGENERLERIFNLYLKEDWSFDDIAKCRIRSNQLNDSTALRVYLIMEEKSYKVFLIDPLHLVIPSQWQRRNNTFKKNKGNGLCMSKAFEKIDEMV
ncbi:hypothetical protein SAMN04488100_10513 [Alkalibacterium putridalgicola]|uniref:Uncharacterized protein n=1 Tax=Alkalibacterium putridalgicola TaxID=426703 RepID=A0A1H7RJI5_9LACT|nr:hypothetical protein [Alkalibacterium putridalgicola]GEK88872.1 hypothetical protein APU01nite_09110 [Alkalibacterium putridalgicola]SEL60265.1 hypothetical protein SAMN04488100_10513 [Alkalibacterium putridalgicola]